MDRKRKECSSSRFFISSSESASQKHSLLNITARYQKGNFSALIVAQIKHAFLCAIPSVKKHGAHRQEERGGCVWEREEREGEREGEREVGGIWRGAMRRNIQRATAAWNRKPFKCKFKILPKNGHGFVFSMSQTCPVVHFFFFSWQRRH